MLGRCNYSGQNERIQVVCLRMSFQPFPSYSPTVGLPILSPRLLILLAKSRKSAIMDFNKRLRKGFGNKSSTDSN